MKKEIVLLREKMRRDCVDVCLIQTSDPHGSEYIHPRYEVRSFFSGFTGDAGSLVVTADKAALWTDGRFFLQAEEELAGSGIELMKSRQPGVPLMEDYIAEEIPEGGILAFDGELVTAQYGTLLRKKISSRHATIRFDYDPSEGLWQNRPSIKPAPIWTLPVGYTGKTAADKLADVRNEMKKKHADAHIISSLDDIAWLFNLRGGDIPRNPVFFAWCIVTGNSARLFTSKNALTKNARASLDEIGVQILPYEDIWEAVRELDQNDCREQYSPEGSDKPIDKRNLDGNCNLTSHCRPEGSDKRLDSCNPDGRDKQYNKCSPDNADKQQGKLSLLIDTAAISYRLLETIPKDVRIIRAANPVYLMKHIKNEVEIGHIYESHHKDGTAMVRFLCWLDNQVRRIASNPADGAGLDPEAGAYTDGIGLDSKTVAPADGTGLASDASAPADGTRLDCASAEGMRHDGNAGGEDDNHNGNRDGISNSSGSYNCNGDGYSNDKGYGCSNDNGSGCQEDFRLTEISASDRLEQFRAEQEGFIDLSFNTIAGYAEHGAIIHYGATPESDAAIRPEGFLLVDSGGQYLDGTTDITRTIAVGPLTEEMREHYTLVLKCNLALERAHFPEGTRGENLDVIARQPLWELGLDYRHGPGHGVGFLLNVHEGPNGFRTNIIPNRLTCAFAPGMVTTDEPGYYREGHYGIRIENELLCVPFCETEYGKFYGFRNLTLCPYERKAIRVDMLTSQELDQINQYHAHVYEELADRLDDHEREWLREATRKL